MRRVIDHEVELRSTELLVDEPAERLRVGLVDAVVDPDRVPEVASRDQLVERCDPLFIELEGDQLLGLGQERQQRGAAALEDAQLDDPLRRELGQHLPVLLDEVWSLHEAEPLLGGGEPTMRGDAEPHVVDDEIRLRLPANLRGRHRRIVLIAAQRVRIATGPPRLSLRPLARGGGLEPPTTGPEPAVLPITPPPNGWTGHDSGGSGGAGSAERLRSSVAPEKRRGRPAPIV